MKKMKGLLVLLVDTGKAVVVMDTQAYKDNIKAMSADEREYKRLKYDPTRGYKEKLVATLTSLKNQGKSSLDCAPGGFCGSKHS